jgi:hypothetical protein
MTDMHNEQNALNLRLSLLAERRKKDIYEEKLVLQEKMAVGQGFEPREGY